MWRIEVIAEMDAKLIPTDINEKMDDVNDASRVLLSSITTTSQSASIQDNYAGSQTGMFGHVF